MLYKTASSKQDVQCEWVFFTGTLKWNKKKGLDSNNHLNNTAGKNIHYIYTHTSIHCYYLNFTHTLF